jgi:hypothetical protein
VQVAPGDTVAFRIEAFDALGRPLGRRQAELAVEGLAGRFAGDDFQVAAEAPAATGLVTARLGDLEAVARVRVVSDLPLSEDFEGVEVGARPGYMLAYLVPFGVQDAAGSKVLAKPPSTIKIDRHITFLGAPWHSDYTITADLLADPEDPQGPDMGLINSGYTMELTSQGTRPGLPPGPKLHVRTWQAGLRIAHDVDYAWKPGTWYRMKLRVDATGDVARVQGKVWPRDAAEPADWTITVEDPLPIRRGAAGLSAYSPSTVYFDNILVSENDR